MKHDWSVHRDEEQGGVSYLAYTRVVGQVELYWTAAKGWVLDGSGSRLVLHVAPELDVGEALYAAEARIEKLERPGVTRDSVVKALRGAYRHQNVVQTSGWRLGLIDAAVRMGIDPEEIE